jgi:hypothetical protein
MIFTNTGRAGAHPGAYPYRVVQCRLPKTSFPSNDQVRSRFQTKLLLPNWVIDGYFHPAYIGEPQLFLSNP